MIAALIAASSLLLPAGRFTAYFTPAFADEAYQKKAVAKILEVWKSPAGAPAGKRTVLIAQIAKNGTLADLQNHLMTGFKPWDDAAIAAVKKAAPFAPLPKSWTFPTMEVHFHFEVVWKDKHP